MLFNWKDHFHSRRKARLVRRHDLEVAGNWLDEKFPCLCRRVKLWKAAGCIIYDIRKELAGGTGRTSQTRVIYLRKYFRVVCMLVIEWTFNM